MFNFSANNLTLLSRTECRSCLVFVMKDRHTHRVYRLYDFTGNIRIKPDDKALRKPLSDILFNSLNAYTSL